MLRRGVSFFLLNECGAWHRLCVMPLFLAVGVQAKLMQLGYISKHQAFKMLRCVIVWPLMTVLWGVVGDWPDCGAQKKLRSTFWWKQPLSFFYCCAVLRLFSGSFCCLVCGSFCLVCVSSRVFNSAISRSNNRVAVSNDSSVSCGVSSGSILVGVAAREK